VARRIAKTHHQPVARPASGRFSPLDPPRAPSISRQLSKAHQSCFRRSRKGSPWPDSAAVTAGPARKPWGDSPLVDADRALGAQLLVPLEPAERNGGIAKDRHLHEDATSPSPDRTMTLIQGLPAADLRSSASRTTVPGRAASIVIEGSPFHPSSDSHSARVTTLRPVAWHQSTPMIRRRFKAPYRRFRLCPVSGNGRGARPLPGASDAGGTRRCHLTSRGQCPAVDDGLDADRNCTWIIRSRGDQPDIR
jgi:hypothetical protein